MAAFAYYVRHGGVSGQQQQVCAQLQLDGKKIQWLMQKENI